MASKLFEYAILYHPAVRRDAQGNETQGKDAVLVDVTRVLADSEREVGMMAARLVPDEYLAKINEVEIVIRPF